MYKNTYRGVILEICNGLGSGHGHWYSINATSVFDHSNATSGSMIAHEITRYRGRVFVSTAFGTFLAFVPTISMPMFGTLPEINFSFRNPFQISSLNLVLGTKHFPRCSTAFLKSRSCLHRASMSRCFWGLSHGIQVKVTIWAPGILCAIVNACFT